MSANLTAYEVRVLIKGDNPIGYNSEYACYYYKETVKMFHQFARTAKQAMDKCRKHGHPISARKVNVSAMFGNFENLKLDGVYQPGNRVYQEKAPVYKSENQIYQTNNQVYQKAVAVDVAATDKRNRRISDLQKDKRGIDK